ncbi:MAG: type IV secretory system conjugative DNA transfer family protein [Planctomycetes bacterium]|nr:type IV secretory system conjugative DNA transfer family protein [Planctomycetota bacterium]
MKSYRLGNLHGTKTPFYVPRSSFGTHWHLLGGTGKGKTTAILTLLMRILLDPFDDACHIIIDRMGSFARDLLLWIASPYCTDDVRRRLVYIEPAREDVVIGFNPLLHDTEAHAYYRVCQATELILRGWANQNIQEMPRLARWMFNSFYACAQLGLTIADSAHLILPGSPLHKPILNALPPLLQAEWYEITRAQAASEASRMLESVRNRLKPYHESSILRRMFGTSTSRLDVARFMPEKKIVLINLHPGNRLPEQVADAIGGLVINEVIAAARSSPFGIKHPTFLWLDEFQRFVSPDIEAALPTVRQLQCSFVLSHQSFSQLERGDVDLTSMIFQAQSRMIFGMQGQDADLVAHELASLRYDPKKIKDQMFSRRQRISGHRLVELESRGFAEQQARSWTEQYGQSWSHSKGSSSSTNPQAKYSQSTEGNALGESSGFGSSESRGRTESHAVNQSLLPVYEDFSESTSKTFASFDEDWRSYGRDVRNLQTGEAFVRLVNRAGFDHIQVKRSAPGHLSLPADVLARELPEVLDGLDALIERNFTADYFSTPAAVDREIEARLQRILSPPIRLNAATPSPSRPDDRTDDQPPAADAASLPNPFIV